jgi:subtilase family serine protease
MKSLHRAVVLSVFLVLLFVGSTMFGTPRVTFSSATSDVNPALNVITPVTPIDMPGFTSVTSLPSSFPVLLQVAVPLNNLALLQSMVQAVSNPQSPQYRQFLSQATIQQDFLPVAQFQSTESYLSSHGFLIQGAYEDSMIVASGTVAQVQSALGLQTKLYSNGTASYYASSGVPTLSGVYIYASNVTSLVVQHPNITVEPDTEVNVPQVSSGVPNVTSPIEATQASNLLSAYNAQALVASGDNGKGKTIGVFEFYGEPYIAQELQAYDQETGLAAPPSFTVVPVGPYNPNVGFSNIEEQLDVEWSHAMAPGASMIVYTANGALDWAPIIAAVDQADAVNVLTQSWFEPEIYFPYEGSGFFLFNVILGDQYFALGSLEGISFLDASGDRGGTGYSGQPLGSQGWPATSPYNTAVGGLTTYLTYSSSGSVVSSLQTAWSNEGFEPTLENFGGGTGGVSSIEPKPWYQDGIATPTSYPNGRLGPDLALNANVFPGVYEVVDSRAVGVSNTPYTTIIEGGTSEAAPLLAGLIVDVDQAISGSLGLINPALYQIGSSSMYTKEFTPITFGYNTPWTESSGFNLVTGWGSPNIGNWVSYFKTNAPGSAPSISVTITNSAKKAQFEFTAGQKVVVSATPSEATPTTTKFTATLVTLQGAVATTTLMYSKALKAWTGALNVPATANGMSWVNVQGMVSGSEAYGSAQLFTGYLATIISPVAVIGSLPWSTQFGLTATMLITDLNGHVITTGKYSLTASSYSLASNTYTPFLSNEKLKESAGIWSGALSGNYPLGPVNIFLNGGVYGFIDFINGPGLTPTFIFPPINVSPGGVSPGQYLQIAGEIQAPENTPNIISAETGEPIAANIQFGSNMTASLVSPTGKVVSSVFVGFTSGTNVFGFPDSYLGYLQVPTDATPGLYTITLSSVYESIDLGININGAYFGQILVVGQPAIVPKVTLSPNPVAEGSTLTITANIAYQNGTEVKYGLYSAALYPTYDSNKYALYSGLPAGQIPLWYNPTTNLWVGSVTMPSDTNLGWIGGYTSFNQGLNPGVVSQPVSGSWDAYVSGITADGVPTTTAISAQQPFTVGPASPSTSSPSSSRPATATDPSSASSSSPSASQSNVPHSVLNLSNALSSYAGIGLLAGVISVAAASTILVTKRHYSAIKKQQV